ncbi:single-stranded-DNA-specific exonuclease RecJ [Spartinivicinus ruber]|uniref:single-stranded-DNA-specific exonuclease RecJ n=1 Tax=Spartinivicinus ruber TaxID=2683272 RepID=UPI0013D70E87|nr:single-stranded-DNA-specific exonuclease RecJ [Spartinivicinus ruber]
MQKRITQRTFDLSQCQFSDSLHPVLQRIYAARGISDEIQLNHSLQALLPFNTFKGVDRAVEVIADAIEAQQQILIVGDFDADGATSSTLAVLALRALGVEKVDYLVPNRFEYGYGLSPEIVSEALRYQPDLIITVDNGISSIAGVDFAKEKGIKIVVTDHHLAGAELPKADAIVNPNQPGCDFPSRNPAGVGVIFYVMVALRQHLRERNWFVNRPEPNMANFLDIVALGTVADVVPLDDNNRILVQQGLKRIRAGKARPGILALIEVAGRHREQLVATDLGFAVGPRLNAAGRLDDMSLGIECLLADDHQRAREIAFQLDELNRDRKQIESDMQQQAVAELQRLQLDQEEQFPTGICLFDATWHQGVIGILAARIKERTHRPVIAFAEGDNGEIKGSARSIPGFHIRDALDAVDKKHPELIIKFGGHAMAAGLSIKNENFEAFCQAFQEVAADWLTQEQLEAEVLTDGELSCHEINLYLASLIREAGPWGQHFPEPVFQGYFQVIQQRIIGEKHLKLMLKHPSGELFVDAIAFNIDLSVWPDQSIAQVLLAYKLDVNYFRGKQNLQLMVEYIEPVRPNRD